MHSVRSVKSAERQAAVLDHMARDFLLRQQTQTVNAVRPRLGVFGVSATKCIHNVHRLLEIARDAHFAAATEAGVTVRPARAALGTKSAAASRPARQASSWAALAPTSSTSMWSMAADVPLTRPFGSVDLEGFTVWTDEADAVT